MVELNREERVFRRCPRIQTGNCCGMNKHLPALARYANQHSADTIIIDTTSRGTRPEVMLHPQGQMFGPLKSSPSSWVTDITVNSSLSRHLNSATITSDTKERLEEAINGKSISTPKPSDCPLKNLRT